MADPRYGAVKVLIESGHVKSIQDIFQYIPKTTVYKDLGINYNRFDRAIINPAIFRLEELVVLAELFDVDAKKMIDMAYEQAVAYRVKKEKEKDSSKITITK
jgi:hypothetical protein